MHAIGRIPNVDAMEVYNSKHRLELANGRAQVRELCADIEELRGFQGDCQQ
jgi:hypothetical protein